MGLKRLLTLSVNADEIQVGRWFLEQKYRSLAKQRTTYPSSGMIMSTVKHMGRNIAGGRLYVRVESRRADGVYSETP
jgi:hypothetical protein